MYVLILVCTQNLFSPLQISNMHFSARVFFSVCETSLQLSLVKVSQTVPISDDFRGGALDTATETEVSIS